MEGKTAPNQQVWYVFIAFLGFCSGPKGVKQVLSMIQYLSGLKLPWSCFLYLQRWRAMVEVEAESYGV